MPRQFRIKPSNPLRPGWSNVAPDGRLVVTLWTHEFENAERRVYDISNAPDESGWTKRSENKHRTAQLEAIGIGGLFESLIITMNPRKAKRSVAFIEAGPTMRLVKLDPSGRFRAEVAHT